MSTKKVLQVSAPSAPTFLSMNQPTTGRGAAANPVAAFAAVLGPRPSGQPARARMLDDAQVTAFVEACRTAIRAAFE